MSLLSRRAFFSATVGIGAGAAFLPRMAPSLGKSVPNDPVAPPGSEYDFGRNLIWAPEKPGDWPAFREALSKWREATRRSLRYDDALYRRPDFAWVPSTFSCHFLMMLDEEFYNPQTNEYTLTGFLDKAQKDLADSIALFCGTPTRGSVSTIAINLISTVICPEALTGFTFWSRTFTNVGSRYSLITTPGIEEHAASRCLTSMPWPNWLRPLTSMGYFSTP